MSTPCLIGRPDGAGAFKAVYCNCDGNPSTMVPVLRRLVLRTFGGRASAASHYLLRYAGFGYWSSLTGSGDAYSSGMRAHTANNGPIHKWTGDPWPQDVDIYHDVPHHRDSLLEFRDGAYIDSPVARWGQQWLYLIYPKALAVVRYVGPTAEIGNARPMGVKCEPIPWLSPISRRDLLSVENQAASRLRAVLARQQGSLAHVP